MRKTSQDDTTSITSGTENEGRKPSTGLAKIKRSSIKKKVQNYSNESDDGVVEPLLQKDKEKIEFSSQSAKFSISKTNTLVGNDKMDDTDKLLPDIKVEKLPLASSSVSDNLINGTKTYACTPSAIHNHMNTNIFSNTDAIKNSVVPKSQILVEIDGNKPSSFSSGPLIFTTAKIHTDGKTTQMEPVQVTPVPIFSTVEGSVIKTSSIVDNQKVDKVTSGKSVLNSYAKSSDVDTIKIDLDVKTATGKLICSKPESTSIVSGFPKISQSSFEDKKGITSTTSNSKISNQVASAAKISESNTMTTFAASISMTKPGITKPQSTVSGLPKLSQCSSEGKKGLTDTTINSKISNQVIPAPKVSESHTMTTTAAASKSVTKPDITKPQSTVSGLPKLSESSFEDKKDLTNTTGLINSKISNQGTSAAKISESHTMTTTAASKSVTKPDITKPQSTVSGRPKISQCSSEDKKSLINTTINSKTSNQVTSAIISESHTMTTTAAANKSMIKPDIAKPQSTVSGLTKVSQCSSEDKKGLTNTTINSKISNQGTSAAKINDNNTMATTTAAASKSVISTSLTPSEMGTSAMPKLVGNEVPKMQVTDKKNTLGSKQEIDVNKNFQLPTCSSLPMNNSNLEKDVTSKDSSNTKQLQRPTSKIEDVQNNKNAKTNSEGKAIMTEKMPSTSKSQTIDAENQNKNNEATKLSRPVVTTIQDKISTPLQVSNISKTQKLTDKFSTGSSATTTPSSTSNMVPSTNTTPKVTGTTISDSTGKKMSTSISSESGANPTVSTISPALKTVGPESKISTKIESVSHSAPLSNTGTTRTTTNSINTPTSMTSLAQNSTKESAQKTGMAQTAKTTISTNKPTVALTSSTTPLSSSGPKSISSNAPISSSVVPSKSDIQNNKLNQPKDQVTRSQIRSPTTSLVTTGSSAIKSPTTTGKTPSTPLTSAAKTISVSSKPSTSGVTSKDTQMPNLGKVGDNKSVSMTASIKSPTIVSSASVVTTTTQKPTVNKSTELRSNDNKKEKFK
ncbi:mucin-5AC-like isoform X1 [Ostrinia furnacalis]|uniref:mucin-5AC-like isoform X1 n=1 Tax=Ostrinia furnacalis TaxID=93504 RepID=UPI00103916D5|nr:mucin-5AC-like isoform X1 [Ostrinia furnacalis]